ncbi:hypothetical protein BX285_7231 [Streptomyces sp. 1114.5]|uniref:hypothetical protein n=1 Tax=unclassified Streptomyces TaxID=2593676 RepID=UPI000BD642B9|nr:MULTISPECIES: hypothetical protein [unclassified Streptomyces]RKT08862.1 hypothetical protein BX285_7231 [Streptomyces sp. 1114.5]SOB79198.1 hypothetical protein SAMN06272789_0307 [Streptomyces sp. 1331.2]
MVDDAAVGKDGGTESGKDGATEGGPQELSRAAAVTATVLAALFASAALLASLHWLGWTVPGIGWIVAKAGIKLTVGGFVVLALALDRLRDRLKARSRS